MKPTNGIMHEEEFEKRLKEWLEADPWRCEVLKAVARLQLPDCWVGAGFIRSFVWDKLSGLPTSVPEDVDVVYYAPQATDENSEKVHDRNLAGIMPGVPWSCKNQARMHIKAGLPAPYKDTGDGLRHWTETATAVAARWNTTSGGIDILAPFGLSDLFDMAVRPTPLFRNRKAEYNARLSAKQWEKRWPRLRFSE